MPNGRPWFKLWVADWYREARFLSAEERGYLIQLWAEAWQSEPAGTLPADPDQLWRFAGAKSRKRFESVSKRVMQSFTLQGERYVSEYLASLYADMRALRSERSIAGQIGAKKRWQGHSKGMANAISPLSQPHGDTERDERRKDEEEEPDKEADSEHQNARAGQPMGRLTGLANAVFRDKSMPRISTEDSQARRRLLKEQAAGFQ